MTTLNTLYARLDEDDKALFDAKIDSFNKTAQEVAVALLFAKATDDEIRQAMAEKTNPACCAVCAAVWTEGSTTLRHREQRRKA